MLLSRLFALCTVARTALEAFSESAVCGVRNCAGGWAGGCATGAGSVGGGSTGFCSAGFESVFAGGFDSRERFERDAGGVVVAGAVGSSETGSGIGSGAGSMVRGGGGGTVSARLLLGFPLAPSAPDAPPRRAAGRGQAD